MYRKIEHGGVFLPFGEKNTRILLECAILRHQTKMLKDLSPAEGVPLYISFAFRNVEEIIYRLWVCA